jgi:integrase
MISGERGGIPYAAYEHASSCARIDVGIFSKQVGHISIATTARYLDHIAPLHVVRVSGLTD